MSGFAVEIPASSPLFEGHFPGHPILPGVAQLALVESALGAPLTGVRVVKLRRPVGPGEVLELSLGEPEGDGWTRFELRRAGEAVSSGAGRTGTSASSPDLPPLDAFSPVEDLLPHAPPARLILGILDASPEGITAVAEVPPGHPLVVDGLAPALLGIEAAAQAAAVLEALQRTDGPGPRIGYLVGIREATLMGAFPAGRPFRVAARLQGGAFPLSIYEIVVEGIVTGTISTYATRDESIRGESIRDE
jgi:3-hydroxymyristoyl/3-hydroxydecanoyl-(acyl carrier protein) dehydratase